MVKGERFTGSEMLSVSIVTYRPDALLLNKTIASLCRAVAHTFDNAPHSAQVPLLIVDNDDELSAGVLSIGAPGGMDCITGNEVGGADAVAVRVIKGQGNVGYGRGHNLALAQTLARYHLVLNPDIDISPDALRIALQFMEAHPEVGLLTPRITDADGSLQYLCRRYPTVLDLFVRGFLPRRLRAPFRHRLQRYELHDLLDRAESAFDSDDYPTPPIVSGCFMLFRGEVLKQTGGFDPRYFLYFEDYDLSLRTQRLAKIAYVPTVRIVHFGGGAARKGWWHIRLFMTSAFKFFNRFGWRWA
ncbi:MAG: glycosyltransferase [Janthinobacterium lividum]